MKGGLCHEIKKDARILNESPEAIYAGEISMLLLLCFYCCFSVSNYPVHTYRKLVGVIKDLFHNFSESEGTQK